MDEVDGDKSIDCDVTFRKLKGVLLLLYFAVIAEPAFTCIESFGDAVESLDTKIEFVEVRVVGVLGLPEEGVH